MPMKKRKYKKRDHKKYLNYLQSKKWDGIRRNALDWFGNQCSKCGSKYNLQVHHKTYKNLYNETMQDLLVLCSRCHWFEHRHKAKLKPKKKEIDYDTVTYYPKRKVGVS